MPKPHLKKASIKTLKDRVRDSQKKKRLKTKTENWIDSFQVAPLSSERDGPKLSREELLARLHKRIAEMREERSEKQGITPKAPRKPTREPSKVTANSNEETGEQEITERKKGKKGKNKKYNTQERKGKEIIAKETKKKQKKTKMIKLSSPEEEKGGYLQEETKKEKKVVESSIKVGHPEKVAGKAKKKSMKETKHTDAQSVNINLHDGAEVNRVKINDKNYLQPFEETVGKPGAKIRRLRSELRIAEQEAARLKSAEKEGQRAQVFKEIALEKAIRRAAGEKVHDDTTRLRKAQRSLDGKKGRLDKRRQQRETNAEEQQKALHARKRDNRKKASKKGTKKDSKRKWKRH